MICPLAECPAGARVQVLKPGADDQSRSRLAGLGIRKGMEIRVEHPANAGTCVVAVLDSRVALGCSLAEQVIVRHA